MRTLLLALVACGTVATGYHFAPGSPPAASPPAAAPASPARLVAHEWGTFTSFSGSDGVPVGFTPNNTDLPDFVYYQGDEFSKVGRLARNGLVSMETPVVYFYTEKETRVSVKVDFPKGWITEWYPFAAGSPVNTKQNDRAGGQSIRWDAKLFPGDTPKFPVDKRDQSGDHDSTYYDARSTDAVPLRVEAPGRDRNARGPVVQHEKFLFYRGVGTFPPPVTVKALGGDKVRVANKSGGRAAGMVLVSVRGDTLGFRAVDALDNGAEAEAQLPEMNAKRADLANLLVKELTAAGLYEKEAKAMVATWEHAWLGEQGTRLLYLVPRAKTDELLPLTIDPKPAEVVRVLVGRHDFITPEQEAVADKQVKRLRAAEAEMKAANAELSKLGRFSPEAQRQAEQRLAKPR